MLGSSVTKDRPSPHPHQGAEPEKLKSRLNKLFPVQSDTLPLAWNGCGFVYSNLECGWHRNVLSDWLRVHFKSPLRLNYGCDCHFHHRGCYLSLEKGYSLKWVQMYNDKSSIPFLFAD